jgi:5-methyltetrahydropteroyltriglutamate--homocysteine methyltransferase
MSMVSTLTDLKMIRTDHVGGLPRPLWLRERQAAFERGEVDAEQLEASNVEAVKGLVAHQEEIGLPILTDGEVTRRNFQESFGGAVTGYDSLPYAYPLDIATAPSGEGANPTAVATERIASGMAENGPAVLHRRPAEERLQLLRNVVLEEYRRTSSMASTPVKVTLIGPDRISQRFAHESSHDVYRDMDEFLADVVAIEREMIAQVVAAGCRYVQIDEPGYTAYVDQISLDTMRGRGEDPEQNLARGIAADNALIRDFPGVTFAVHICRGGGGGRGGKWIHREGHYDPIAEQLYSELNFDRFLLEYDSDAAGGFDTLRFLPSDKIAVLGLVSNHGEVETREYLESRLEQASKFIPLEQAAICPRCGFGGSGRDESVVWAKLALLQEVARDTWA